MCSLCSALGGSRYWTDSAGQEAFASEGGRRVSLMAERRQRVALLNVILDSYSVSVSDWGGSSYVVRCGDGRSCDVHSLIEIWTGVDGLVGQAVDPLDPVLVERLAGVSGEGPGA
jgi:hypothetical protein